jgi:hypothetical protein
MGRMKTITILTLSILLFSSTLNAEEKNYCEDSDVNMHREALIQKCPDNLQVYALHALRPGLQGKGACSCLYRYRFKSTIV